MLKKILFTLTVISVFFMPLNVYAYIHKLKNNWYDEDASGTNKENVTSITFEEETFDKEKNKNIFWELDGDGLVAYMESDTDVVIAIPEGDTLETSFNANDIFSFYKENRIDRNNYETGENGQKIYGVQPDDGSFPVDDFSKYESDLEQIMGLELLETYPTENYENFFKGLKNLTTIDVTSLHTPFAKSFKGMFMGCENLERIDLSFLDTSKVTDMSDMFRDCKRLTSIKFGDLKTYNLENMSGMFENCERLNIIDLNRFNTSKVTDMTNMFKNCVNLETLIINKFDTKEVRKTESMFDNCRRLKQLDISNFNMLGVNRCIDMFIDCQLLESLDLRGFNFTGNVVADNLLSDCINLKALLLSDSLCKQIHKLGLIGIWQNVTTKAIYDFENYDGVLPISGGYVKIS